MGALQATGLGAPEGVEPPSRLDAAHAIPRAETDIAAAFARVLATCDGLRQEAPTEKLAPWMRHARLAASFFEGYYKSEIDRLEADIGRLRERLSGALAAGLNHHSDCAVYNAPALEPEPCDCGEQS